MNGAISEFAGALRAVIPPESRDRPKSAAIYECPGCGHRVELRQRRTRDSEIIFCQCVHDRGPMQRADVREATGDE